MFTHEIRLVFRHKGPEGPKPSGEIQLPEMEIKGGDKEKSADYKAAEEKAQGIMSKLFAKFTKLDLGGEKKEESKVASADELKNPFADDVDTGPSPTPDELKDPFAEEKKAPEKTGDAVKDILANASTKEEIDDAFKGAV